MGRACWHAEVGQGGRPGFRSGDPGVPATLAHPHPRCPSAPSQGRGPAAGEDLPAPLPRPAPNRAAVPSCPPPNLALFVAWGEAGGRWCGPTLVDLLTAPERDEPGAIFFADWGRDLRCLFLLGIQGHLFMLYMLFYTMMVWPAAACETGASVHARRLCSFRLVWCSELADSQLLRDAGGLPQDFLLVNTYAAAVLTYVLHVTLVAVRCGPERECRSGRRGSTDLFGVWGITFPLLCSSGQVWQRMLRGGWVL